MTVLINLAIYEQSFSQKSKIFASSLYTREPVLIVSSIPFDCLPNNSFRGRVYFLDPLRAQFPLPLPYIILTDLLRISFDNGVPENRKVFGVKRGMTVPINTYLLSKLVKINGHIKEWKSHLVLNNLSLNEVWTNCSKAQYMKQSLSLLHQM